MGSRPSESDHLLTVDFNMPYQKQFSEVMYGLERNPPRARRIAPVVEALLSCMNVVEYAEADARETGRVRAELEQTGQAIGVCDSMLAGTARRRALTMVTHNTHEFRRVDQLHVTDWYLPHR